LRLAIIAELDAVNLYEQLAAATENKGIRKILLDLAKEEKTHIGEFQTLLLKVDQEQVEELKRGKEEVEEELDL
jgi:rubrerythrin